MRLDSRLNAWKTNPILRRADVGEPLLRKLSEGHAVDFDLAGSGPQETPEHRQERGLARSGRAHDQHQLAASDLQRDAGDGLHRARRRAVDLRHVAGAHERCLMMPRTIMTRRPRLDSTAHDPPRGQQPGEDGHHDGGGTQT